MKKETIFDTPIDTRTLLSTLWIVVMINMLKADILSLYIPGTVDSLVAFADGTPITSIMLGGAIMMELSIAMIFISRIAKYRINRILNGVMSCITILFVIGGGSTYPHYIFIATVEVVVLLAILTVSLKWKAEQ